MELTEEKLFAAFGLTPDNQGGNGPEIAEPAEGGQTEQQTESGDEGRPLSVAYGDSSPRRGASQENERDPGTGSEIDQEENAEGAVEGMEGEEPDGTGGDAGGAGAPGGLPQTAQERRANAARRRQQETQAAIDTAVQQALQRQAQEFADQQQAFFQQAQLINPFTKEPITNMEEFQAWRQAQNDERIQQELKSGKLTVETLNQMVSEAVSRAGLGAPNGNAPSQAQARNAAQEAEQQREAEAQQAQQFERDVQAQLAEIRKADPSVQSVGDLLNRPYSAEFYAAVKRGSNFLDAFRIATANATAAQAAASARQRAINSVNSKAHMKRTGIGGKAGATVTAEEAKMYRIFNPKATPEQIQAYQNKVKKG